MSNKLTQVGWGFWMWWVLATAFSYSLGLVIIEDVDGILGRAVGEISFPLKLYH
jgi:hypothetical protein